jgi:hypothetical protein
MSNFYNNFHNVQDLLGFEQYVTTQQSLFIVDFITGDVYPRDKDTIDLFEHVDKSYKWYIVNFAGEGDCRAEGYNSYPAFKEMHFYAEKHNIPIHKIILFSSNLQEQESYDNYCVNNNITDKFKIFIWAPLQNRIQSYSHSVVPLEKRNFEKLFLCLNAGVAKSHRSYLTYLMFKQDLIQDTHLSFYKFKAEDLDIGDYKTKRRMQKFSPQFFNSQGNSAFSCPMQQVKTSLISVVNETHYHDYDSNIIDITEKVFKPILWEQPLIIFGPKDINKNIGLLGFKTYEDFFDLSFDNEEDWIVRYEKGVSELKRMSRTLKDPKSRARWIKQRKEILEYNKQVLLSDSFNRSTYKDFLKYIGVGGGI